MPLLETIGSGGARGLGMFGAASLGIIPSNPASSGVALYDAGYRTSGLYYITTSQGVKEVYVDLTTLDATTNKAGWMLVGSWGTAWTWSQPSTTSSSTFSTSALNAFSSNFGTMQTQFVRMHVSSSISSTGTNADSCDFYHYASSSAPWREWWVTNSNNDIVWSVGATNNGGAIPREAMRQFTHSYNIKYNYQVGQNWNCLSDGSGAPIIGRQGDWWNGLNGTATSIGWFGATDGSLAILPQGSGSTGAGQDCNENQTKFGSDDGTLNVAMFGASATANVGQSGTLGSNTNFWLWIK